MQGTLTVHALSPLESFDPDSWITKFLKSELGGWKEKAKMELGAVLGYPNWKTASKNILHPTERITARFLCKRCVKLPIRYRDDGCFDFAGACLHECPAEKRKTKNLPWRADNFVKDEKAIATLIKLLSLCGVDASSQGAAAAVVALGATVACLTCESRLIMDSKCIVGHSHRHHEMSIKLIPRTETGNLLKYPLLHGLISKLTRPGKPAEISRGKKIYGCRHCALLELRCTEDMLKISQDARLTIKNKNASKPKRSIADRAMIFDGLRSHLKEKHRIQDVRDEDLILCEPNSL